MRTSDGRIDGEGALREGRAGRLRRERPVDGVGDVARRQRRWGGEGCPVEEKSQERRRHDPLPNSPRRARPRTRSAPARAARVGVSAGVSRAARCAIAGSDLPSWVDRGRRSSIGTPPRPKYGPKTPMPPATGYVATARSDPAAPGATIAAMLDHEEKFLFKEEILHLSNAVAEPGVLDNVEDLLTDVITSPRFDSEVFTLERSLQVMLGPRAGTTLVGLLTVAPEVFDEVAEVRIPSEVHERLVAWRARFGLAIDNALNFLNNPDGIQGHNFATQIAHVEDRRVLQGRLTLVRYNNEPQFFVADASVFLSLVADIMERLGPYLEPDAVEAETLARLRDAIPLIERKTASRS